MSIVGWIVMGLIAGWLARAVVGSERRGCIYTVIVGVLGALVGGALFSLVTDDDDIIDGFDLGSVAVAFVGACLLLLVLEAVGGGDRRRSRRR